MHADVRITGQMSENWFSGSTQTMGENLRCPLVPDESQNRAILSDWTLWIPSLRPFRTLYSFRLSVHEMLDNIQYIQSKPLFKWFSFTELTSQRLILVLSTKLYFMYFTSLRWFSRGRLLNLRVLNSTRNKKQEAKLSRPAEHSVPPTNPLD